MRRPSTASLIFPYNNIIIRLLRTFQTNLVSVYGQAAEDHFFGRCQQNAIASVGNQIWKFVFDSMGDAPRRLFQMDSAFTERTCCIEPFSFFQSKTACCAHRLAHFRSGSDPVYFLPARFRCPYPETAAHLSFCPQPHTFPAFASPQSSVFRASASFLHPGDGDCRMHRRHLAP